MVFLYGETHDKTSYICMYVYIYEQFFWDKEQIFKTEYY